MTQYTHFTHCTDANTSLLTTFRSDNINGVGLGGLVFAYALPCGLKRSVDQLEAQSVWAPSQKLSEQCRKEYARCNNQRCDMSRVSCVCVCVCVCVWCVCVFVCVCCVCV